MDFCGYGHLLMLENAPELVINKKEDITLDNCVYKTFIENDHSLIYV